MSLSQVDQRRVQKRAILILLFCLVIGAIATTIIVKYALLLRPLADDYCYGAVATLGLRTSTEHWWMSWSSEYLLYGMKSLAVGLPLALLGPRGSSVAFLASGLSVGAVVTLMLVRGIPPQDRRRRSWLVLAALGVTVVPVLWWVHLRVANVTGDVTVARFASITTHWQDVNIGYVVATALNVAMFLAVAHGRLPAGARGLTLSGLFGLAAPMLGLSLGESLACVALAALCVSWWWGKPWHHSRASLLGVYGVAALIGTLVVVAGIGTRHRLAIQGGLKPFDLAGFQSFISEVPWNLLPAFFDPSLVLIFASGVFLGLLSSMSGMKIAGKSLLQSGTWVGAVAVVLIPVTRISQYFNYPALWHWTPEVVLTFILALVGGFWAGISLDNLGIRGKAPRWIAPTVVTFLAATMVVPLAAMGLQSLDNDIVVRERMWRGGSAPTLAGADVTPGSGWGACWATLERTGRWMRTAPFKGYPQDFPPTLPLPPEVKVLSP